jgi:glycolate oxidase
MALIKDAYKELEDILGPENISADPAIIMGYSYFRGVGYEVDLSKVHDGFFLSPEAVVMPGSTREVQAIVRLCNRRQIKCKPFSTGYGPHNAVESQGEIIMDLRRMNRILDIDERNMYIVIEPYVTFAQVQAEAHKRGLNCHIPGAGCQVSALASTTAVAGHGIQGMSQGIGGRNMLAMEWVQPNGEILNFGSLGSGAGWFSCNGPGPSLRGLVRGMSGTGGTLGVFTKCAMRLNPWPGPAKMELKGVSPYYETELPPTFEYHIYEWPTWEKCADALYKVGEAQIALAMHKTCGPGTAGPVVTGNNNEYYAKRQAGEMLIPRVSFAVVTYANTQEEHDYQVKVLDRIMQETGGKIWAEGEKPDFKKRDYVNMIRSCFIPRLAYRPSGSFSVDGIVGMGSVDNCALGAKLDDIHSDKFRARGAILDDGTNNSWLVTFDGSHFGLVEAGQPFDFLDEESVKGLSEMVKAGDEIRITTPIGAFTVGSELEQKYMGEDLKKFNRLLRQIKDAYDPNGTFESRMYMVTVDTR